MPPAQRTIPVADQRGPIDCPFAPPAHATVYARTLHRACLIVGGIDRLAQALGHARPDLERWIRGEDTPPESVFHGAVEIVLLDTAQPGRPLG